MALVALVVLALGTSCGDDAEDSADSTTAATEGSGDVCAARDDLDASVAALGELEVVADGTDALREQVDAIREDLDTVRSAAGDEVGDEVDDVQAALDSLDESLDGFDEAESTSAAVVAVGTALTDLGVSAGALSEALSVECD